MSSKISHSIKHRKHANDVFITPRGLAKQHIEMVEEEFPDETATWLDPCKNSGSYYNQFPNNVKKEYCEILEGKNFFDYQGSPDVICDNPPYSLLDKWFKKVIEINPQVYSTLIGVGNLTARRIEMFEKAGYGISRLKMLKVFKWYGMSYIVVFTKNKKSILEIDRTVWREEPKPIIEKKKKKVKLEIVE